MKPHEMTALDAVLLLRKASTHARLFDHESASTFDDLADRIQDAMMPEVSLMESFPDMLRPFASDAANALLAQFGPVPEKDTIDLPSFIGWEDFARKVSS